MPKTAGIKAYCEQFRDSYALWWDDLGESELNQATIGKLIDGLREEIGSRDYDALRRERDAKLVALWSAIHKVDAGHDQAAAV
ncbi:hypothetical protein [Mesorhizobium sp. WSM3860]|uniref:hypothetical protein n=1 Tax=Mesorhizobium sp. WSM3860 TaxID=2029403 RepID=UPI000BAEF51A|nr:hypothetical protein [Mesorhizobium sp. WSM3860]PBC01388.1 hypothetical protein CK220_26500 [Mesorhizobium sp. WSM3860]